MEGNVRFRFKNCDTTSKDDIEVYVLYFVVVVVLSSVRQRNINKINITCILSGLHVIACLLYLKHLCVHRKNYHLVYFKKKIGL